MFLQQPMVELKYFLINILIVVFIEIYVTFYNLNSSSYYIKNNGGIDMRKKLK